jgi:8-oxo-dGTP pyrophosphatase MutT (NUDIX family)
MDDMVTKFVMKPGGNWGTGVLVLDSENRVLIGKRTDNQLWCTPGGRVRAGETPLQGVIRECREESNLSIKPEFVDVNIDKGKDRLWMSFCFIAKNPKGEIKPQESEISRWEWKPLNEVKKLKLFGPTKKMLEAMEEKKLI